MSKSRRKKEQRPTFGYVNNQHVFAIDDVGWFPLLTHNELLVRLVIASYNPDGGWTSNLYKLLRAPTSPWALHCSEAPSEKLGVAPSERIRVATESEKGGVPPSGVLGDKGTISIDQDEDVTYGDGDKGRDDARVPYAHCPRCMGLQPVLLSSDDRVCFRCKRKIPKTLSDLEYELLEDVA